MGTILIDYNFQFHNVTCALTIVEKVDYKCNRFLVLFPIVKSRVAALSQERE